MIARLTKEQSQALNAGEGTLELIDPAGQASAQQKDLAAIAQGIAQMEAGLGKPLDEAVADIRARLELPARIY
jgi:hypothetical protein